MFSLLIFIITNEVEALDKNLVGKILNGGKMFLREKCISFRVSFLFLCEFGNEVNL